MATSAYSSNERLRYDAFPIVAVFQVATGEVLWTDGAAPSASEIGTVSFQLATRATRTALVDGRTHDSSAVLTLPAADPDDEASFRIETHFFAGESWAVLLTGEGEIPRQIVEFIVEQICAELADKDPAAWRDVARETEWMLLRVLRGRIRTIEQSVRQALEGDHVTASDYEALREYPARLARVARLFSELPEPEWKSHRAHEGVPWRTRASVKPLVNLGNEAREAEARLSGLISSQQVLLAQKQAVESARFQRLVTVVGAAVLVPGLVAGVFGSNVAFPGRDKAAAFWAMLLLMVGGAAGSYALLRSVESGIWASIAQRNAVLRRLSGLTDRARVLGLLAFAAVTTVSAIAILATL